MLGWKEARVGQVSAIRDAGGWGSFAKWLANLLTDTAAPSSIPRVPEFVYVAEVNLCRCIKKKLDSGMKMSIKPYLVLGIGKLVVYKKMWRWPRPGGSVHTYKPAG